ncbi:methyltransferase family protein [Teredinibacter turnerae]|uniref:methyltransferase family protein n=1 Tax=Teredinibacter turnerae TaxID=2426 RepID=UPI00040F49FA|nr:isoprenylcysteine carboxylmethyltransferase family protein [Teredinibacter turnerae]
MILAYKVVSIVVFLVFCIYVFDIRNKKGMEKLINNAWIAFMKLVASAMLFLYAYLVIVLQTIHTTDYVALGLTSLGTVLVVTAKVTLGKYHTWTGYHLKETRIVNYGIYSRLRHPLYTGAILFEIGTLLVMGPRILIDNAVIATVIALIYVYMIIFNITMARQESEQMKQKFGKAFDDYSSQVRAFWPIRKRPRNETIGESNI